jgi:hypothetical protein
MKRLNPRTFYASLSSGPKWPAALVFFALLLMAPASVAAQQEKPNLPANPGDLVRAIVNRELNDSSGQMFTWKERVQKPNRSVTKRLVETPNGLIGRVIAINDRPPSDDERKRDDDRINRLLDPKQMAEKRKQQKQDEDRTLKMVRSLPDAFIYEYAGTETAPNGHLLVHLKFTPNPNFNPPTRETLVFQGMKGSMTFDDTAKRMVKIDGTLFKDVTIGWGIIGRLNQGGHFYVEQAEVYKDHWDQVRMDLEFTGKALLFKSIKISERDTQFDFQPVQSMNVAQALDFLRKQDGTGSTVNAETTNITNTTRK